LVLIKKSVDDSDSFSPETFPAYFPGNEEAFQIFSFSDYVTTLQAERLCKTIDPVPFRSPSGATTDFGITGIAAKGYNWQVPFVQCDSRRCTEDGQDAVPFCEYLALGLASSATSDHVGMAQAIAFRDYIYQRYPQLANKAELPFGFNFVQMFGSDQDVATYVTSSEYDNAENPKLALAVVFDGTDDTYNFTYKIRVNSTGHNSPEDAERPGWPTTPPTDKKFEHYAKNDENTCPIVEGTAELGPYHNSCTGQYIYNGFLTIQRLIHDFIMNYTGARENGFYVAEHGVQYSPFPSPGYEEDGFYAAVAGRFLVPMGIHAYEHVQTSSELTLLRLRACSILCDAWDSLSCRGHPSIHCSREATQTKGVDENDERR
jgi:hypothetical protein